MISAPTGRSAASRPRREPVRAPAGRHPLSDPHAGLYVHIPFCEQRCTYCDFYTVARRGSAIPRYVDALASEVAGRAKGQWRKRSFSTLFFGGGTPSLLTPGQIGELVAAMHRYFDIAARAEVTMEVNPGSASAEKLAGYFAAGVNRLSIGVQSFHEDELRQVERLHNAAEIARTVADARAAGFANISVDLIFALPGQSRSRWHENLERALALAPEHISTYNLTIEPGTPLFKAMARGELIPLGENEQRSLYLDTIAFLEDAGFAQYEVSNFSIPGMHSRHNYKYWDGSLYLGLGASAHSYDGRRRFWNVANFSQYMTRLEADILPEDGEEVLSDAQRRFEMIFLGLRRTCGLDIAAFNSVFSCNFEIEYEAALAPLLRGAKPLLTRNGDLLQLTREGLMLCDSVCAAFLD